MSFSVVNNFKMPIIQADLRQAAEKNVLTYLIALGYDQKPRQLILERGLTFTPLPPDIIRNDPAAESNVLCIDYNNVDMTPSNGNRLATMSGESSVKNF